MRLVFLAMTTEKVIQTFYESGFCCRYFFAEYHINFNRKKRKKSHTIFNSEIFNEDKYKLQGLHILVLEIS